MDFKFNIPPAYRRLGNAAALIGAATAGWGLAVSPERTWANLLLDSFYAASLAVAGLMFIVSQRLAGARWSSGLRRVPEALMLTLPLSAVLILCVSAGRSHLYKWSRPEGLAMTTAGGKGVYFTHPWLTVRVTVALLIWCAFALLLRRASLRQDGDARRGLSLHFLMNRYAAIFVPLFAVSFTILGYDCLLSLEPQWFSTMFGMYLFAGTFVQGAAAVALACAALSHAGYLPVSRAQFRDLGQLLFAFSTFWAYLWICQYLLIWYGNIPEEVTHYVTRTSPQWMPLFLANFAVNWLAPFVLLLSAKAKAKPVLLGGVGLLILCGRWLDLYLVIMPAVGPAPRFGPIEAGLAIGYAALIFLGVARHLADAPLIPVNDPVAAADEDTWHTAGLLSRSAGVRHR